MKRIFPQPFSRNRILSLALILLILALCACTTAPSGTETGSQAASDLPTMPETAAPAVPDTPPTVESYPFSVLLDNGEEITVTLPRDPELYAELHLCAMSGEEIPVRTVLLDVSDDPARLLDEVRVFSGEDGTEYPVITPTEILNRYAVFADGEDAWRMTVSGAEYLIPKAQFAHLPTDSLFAFPDPSKQQNFYVENGQLFCRVFFLCADTEDGYAAESLRIRYDLIDTTVTASEITFLRTETEDAEETP